MNALAWLLPATVVVCVTAFFLLVSSNPGPFDAAFRAAHPRVLPAIAAALIALAPVSVLIYHAVATSAARRRTKGPAS